MRGWPQDFDVTAEAIMDGKYGYHEAVLKLIVLETRLEDCEGGAEKALLTKREVRKCFKCVKPGHLANACRKYSNSV